MIVLTDLHM